MPRAREEAVRLDEAYGVFDAHAKAVHVLLPQALQVRLPPNLCSQALVAANIRLVPHDDVVGVIVLTVVDGSVVDAASICARAARDAACERDHDLELAMAARAQTMETVAELRTH